jgi:Peptidase family M28/PDZ domain
MRRWMMVTAALALGTGLFAQETKPNLVKKDIEFLASEALEGRGLLTKGIIRAGDYIAKSFEDSGLKPGNGKSYFQEFDVPAPSELAEPMAVAIKFDKETKKLDLKSDVTITLSTGQHKKAYPIVFLGYGITSTGDTKYDDYADIDVKDKVVIVLRKSPQADKKDGPFPENNPHSPLVAKIGNAIEHKAAGIIFVSDRMTAAEEDKLMPADFTRRVGPMSGPVLHMTRAYVDSILATEKTSLKELEAKIDETLKPKSFEIKTVQLESEAKVVKKVWPTRNVIAVSEGNGPLKDETVIIGAHYDHVGMGEGGSMPANKGKIHFGADDNGSGTTGLLELARRYGAMKKREGRRIVFIAFSGEEQGLHGSIFYAKNPTFPLDKTVFMLNMDMIGRVTPVEEKTKEGKAVKQDRIVVYGTATSTGLDALVEGIAKKLDFKMLKVPGGQGPSDHTSFYNKGVPVLHFFTGTHPDYHTPADTADKINIAGLLKSVDFVQAAADHYLTVEKKPDYLKTKGGAEDPTNPNSGVSRVNMPTLGITPGNYGEVDAGVMVGGTRKDGPAEKAGILEGDLIIEIAGKEVKNMDGYMRALGSVKPNTEVDVVVRRKGEKVTLKAKPLPPTQAK